MDSLLTLTQCPLVLARSHKEGKSPQTILLQQLLVLGEFAATWDFHGWELPKRTHAEIPSNIPIEFERNWSNFGAVKIFPLK